MLTDTRHTLVIPFTRALHHLAPWPAVAHYAQQPVGVDHSPSMYQIITLILGKKGGFFGAQNEIGSDEPFESRRLDTQNPLMGGGIVTLE